MDASGLRSYSQCFELPGWRRPVCDIGLHSEAQMLPIRPAQPPKTISSHHIPALRRCLFSHCSASLPGACECQRPFQPSTPFLFPLVLSMGADKSHTQHEPTSIEIKAQTLPQVNRYQMPVLPKSWANSAKSADLSDLHFLQLYKVRGFIFTSNSQGRDPGSSLFLLLRSVMVNCLC